MLLVEKSVLLLPKTLAPKRICPEDEACHSLLHYKDSNGHKPFLVKMITTIHCRQEQTFKKEKSSMAHWLP